MTEVDVADMLQIHKFLFEISVWYMQVYVTYNFEPPAYKVPVASESNLLKEKDMDELIKPYVDQKLDDMKTEFQRQLEEIRAGKRNGTKCENKWCLDQGQKESCKRMSK